MPTRPLCRLTVLLVAAATFAPAQTADAQLESRSGFVRTVEADRIVLDNSLQLKVTAATRIWKGEDGASIRDIHPGDELAMRGRTQADGTFLPTEIWVNITALDGIIRKVAGDLVEVEEIRNDGLQPTRRIRLTGKTSSSENVLLNREHVQPGRQLRVIGLKLTDGTVQASRVTVYIGRRPIN